MWYLVIQIIWLWEIVSASRNIIYGNGMASRAH